MKKQIALGAAALAAGGAIMFLARSQKPAGAKPIKDFNPERYMGKWYEIARFDFKEEKNLINTSAEYKLNRDGTIEVINRGYDTLKRKWRTTEGKARFRKGRHNGALKVSFFGPVYSGYNIIDIDEDYQHALVVGKNLDYMWLLSRNTSIPDSAKERYLQKAENLGYDLSRLIWVRHTEV